MTQRLTSKKKMKLRFCLLCCFSFLHSVQCVFSQGYIEYSYPGASKTSMRDLTYCSDKGYAFSGSMEINSVTSNFVAKVDSTGNLEWIRKFDGGETYSIIETPDNEFLVTGVILIRSNYDGFVMKLNQSGDLLWRKYYGENAADDLHQCCISSDGNYVFTGRLDFLPNTSKVWLLKTDTSGTPLWSYQYGPGSTSVRGYSLTTTSENGYMISGNIGTMQTYLVKTDSAGSCLWKKTYDNTGEGRWICQTSDGDYVFTGPSESSFPHTRIDSSGNVRWTKYLTISQNELFGCSQVIQTRDSGFCLIGYCYETMSLIGSGGLIFKTDENGDTLWSKKLLGKGFCGVIETNEGNLTIGGTKSGVSFLLFWDAEGNNLNSIVGNEPEESISVVIYPNPIKDEAGISVSGSPSSRISMKIFSANGEIVKEVKDIRSGTSVPFNRKSLPSGIYFLVVQQKDDLKTLQFVLQ